jgi:DNA-binding transcriptional regulator YdaS (Cro superfamily)
MNQVQAACAVTGGQAGLSRVLGVTAAAVNQWIKGLRPVPPKHCLAIERATNGAVTRRDLRPDDCHLIWPDLAPTRPTQAGEPAHG